MKPQNKYFLSAVYRRSMKRSIEAWKNIHPLFHRAPADIRKAFHYLLEPLTFEDNRPRRNDKDNSDSTPKNSLKY